MKTINSEFDYLLMDYGLIALKKSASHTSLQYFKSEMMPGCTVIGF